MSYLWIEHRADGTVVAERRGVTNEKLASAPRRRKVGPGNGCWQESMSNGFVGTAAELARQRRDEAARGVEVQYRPVMSKVGHDGVERGVYLPRFESRGHRNRWLRAYGRVDLDGGYRDPVPGDFVGRA